MANVTVHVIVDIRGTIVEEWNSYYIYEPYFNSIEYLGSRMRKLIQSDFKCTGLSYNHKSNHYDIGFILKLSEVSNCA